MMLAKQGKCKLEEYVELLERKQNTPISTLLCLDPSKKQSCSYRIRKHMSRYEVVP